MPRSEKRRSRIRYVAQWAQDLLAWLVRRAKWVRKNRMVVIFVAHGERSHRIDITTFCGPTGNDAAGTTKRCKLTEVQRVRRGLSATKCIMPVGIEVLVGTRDCIARVEVQYVQQRANATSRIAAAGTQKLTNTAKRTVQAAINQGWTVSGQAALGGVNHSDIAVDELSI